MELDISKIVADKIKDMEDSGALQRKIEEGIEKTVYGAIEDTFGGYEFSRKIKTKVSESIDVIIPDIGFTAYNQMILNKIRQIMEVELNNDVAAKIENSINSIFSLRHDGIKLSEIFKEYRQWVNADKDHDEKVDRECFTCEVVEEERTYESGNMYFRVRFHDEELSSVGTPDIEFLISKPKKDEAGEIYLVKLEGNYTDKKFSLRYLSSVEALILNLYYNHTPIIIDLDDINNYDNQYDYELD